MKLIAPGCVLLLCAGCASHPDHFYVLEGRPVPTVQAQTAFSQQLLLRVTLPSLVDRAEFVLTTGQGVAVLEHERWGSPLVDQMTTTLSQDIEQRRSNVFASPRGVMQGLPITKVGVDLTALSARKAGRVSIEVQWRVLRSDAAQETLGRETFTSTAKGDGYSDVAAALSDCLGQLADRLVQEVPQT